MIQKNISLKDHSNYKIGGNADYFAEINSKEDLQDVLLEWKKISSEFNNVFILGSGTNILFSDDGFRGLVIKNCINFIVREGEDILVGSGALFSDLVEFFALNRFSGLEWAGGLPGTVGGAIRGNAGAFGGETKDNVLIIESLNLKTLQTTKWQNSECDFNYRSSIFKTNLDNQEIILSAGFKFTLGELEEIKSKTQANIDYRIERHPLDLPNIGSIFKNVDLNLVPETVQNEFESNIKKDPFPVLPVAKLIIGSGLVGKVIGGAQISTKHPNFIVNIGTATSSDVKRLIQLAKISVKEKYNIDLEEEIIVI